jgi:hypothetical protein
MKALRSFENCRYVFIGWVVVFYKRAYQPLNITALCAFETSGYVKLPSTQRNIQEEKMFITNVVDISRLAKAKSLCRP